MLDKINSIKKFKYSFIALFALSGAIVLNLLSVFNLTIIALMSILCTVFLLISTRFIENIKLSLIISAFFILGLVSSSIYNANFRVFPLSDAIHEEKTWVKGQISEIKVKGKYAQIYLANPEIYSDLVESLDYNYIPNMIVSTFASRLTDAKIGDELVAKVLLQKPSGKLFADDFNYQNYLLQNRINLRAQVRGALYVTAPEDGYSLLQKIQNYRKDVFNKITQSYQNKEVAGLSSALITGYRGAVDYELKEVFKKSGLAHLMAISGMHMAFLAGIIFVLVRYLLCLVPIIALNFDSKKIAGAITVLFALFYLLLAGCSLPTLRAFLMVLLFVVTMILNRSKVALHTLCVVAILILLFDPVAIFSASFQLSFSAVFAMLIYNQAKQDELIVNYSSFAKTFRSFINTANISILAFTATMFFVSAHFGYLSIYSILANITASLLMALLVMPSLFLYFVGFVVFDIELFAKLNDFSLNTLINIAQYFAGFENSSVYISQIYSYVLLAVALVILSVIIFDFSRKYLISLAVFSLAFIIPVKLDLRPKIIEFSNGSVGVRQKDNLVLLGQLDKRGLKKVSTYYKTTLSDNNLSKSCDIAGCVYNFEDKKILQMNEGFEISNEDLNLADYVVSN
ncbi:MAG TPA: hypothetical protein DCL21_05620 [Alphaproteobacteria bacterium]|nr:hypothetical protein [Alphaproteobacteria bacterium]